jgi:hypothetical protein
LRFECSFLLQHFDLPSLPAGKLHAAITRKYAKGRDWYDLLWYLSQRPPVTPNLRLLQNALDQTQGAGRHDARSWRTLVAARLGRIDAHAIAEDVRQFLERPQDAALLTRENLVGLLAPGPGEPASNGPDPRDVGPREAAVNPHALRDRQKDRK